MKGVLLRNFATGIKVHLRPQFLHRLQSRIMQNRVYSVRLITPQMSALQGKFRDLPLGDGLESSLALRRL
jgi:hypothetical protein